MVDLYMFRWRDHDVILLNEEKRCRREFLGFCFVIKKKKKVDLYMPKWRDHHVLLNEKQGTDRVFWDSVLFYLLGWV